MKPPAITAIAPWMGSKRKLAGRINGVLGERAAYYEPFFGSGAVLFNAPPARHEVVNDLNRDLFNVAKCLQQPLLARDLLARLHYTLCAESAYRESRAAVAAPFTGAIGDIDRGYHALVYWWLGRNGNAGCAPSRAGFSARFTSNGGSGGVRFRNFVSSIPWFVKRLARVEVLNTDALGMLAKIRDAAGTAIYCDPPYVEKAMPYLHDFGSRNDHARLAEALSRFTKARVVVSYYPHPLVDQLYPLDRWARIEIVTTKNIRNTNSRATGATKATELLLVNGRVT